MLATALLMATLGASPAAADYAGTWDVKLTASYSSCKDRNAGDSLSEQWVLSAAADGSLVAKVTSSSKEAKDYKGKIKSDGSIVLNAGSEVGVELSGSATYLSGRRVVASHSVMAGACAIIYELHADKAK
jgi:hypothetical protein